jgi:hypothetical protein
LQEGKDRVMTRPNKRIESGYLVNLVGRLSMARAKLIIIDKRQLRTMTRLFTVSEDWSIGSHPKQYCAEILCGALWNNPKIITQSSTKKLDQKMITFKTRI